MRSPSRMSEMIRAKKKLMREDPDVIDSGGSPRHDLQDIEIKKRDEATDELNDNNPKEHDTMNDMDGNDMSPAAEMHEEEHEQKANANKNWQTMSMKEKMAHMARGGAVKRMADGGEVDDSDEDDSKANDSAEAIKEYMDANPSKRLNREEMEKMAEGGMAMKAKTLSPEEKDGRYSDIMETDGAEKQVESVDEPAGEDEAVGLQHEDAPMDTEAGQEEPEVEARMRRMARIMKMMSEAY